MKSRTKVDTDAVKQFNEEVKNWKAHCRVCHVDLVGTLADMRKHIEECHGEQG